MAIPNLDDMTDMLDRKCADILGEEIQYQAAGGAFAPVQAHVDYRDMVKPLEGAEAIQQNIALAVPMLDLPAKPMAADRVQLRKRPGKTFRPFEPRRDESGTHWLFELVLTNG